MSLAEFTSACEGYLLKHVIWTPAARSVLDSLGADARLRGGTPAPA